MNFKATLDGQKIRVRGGWGHWNRSTFLARDGAETAEGDLLVHVSAFASRIDALHIVVAGRHVYAEGDNPPDRVWQRLLNK